MTHGVSRRLPSVWLEMALIVVLGTVLAVSMNVVRADSLPWVADFAAQAKREALRKGLETIDVHGAIPLQGRPGVVFLDARTPDEYARGHVAGAKNLPQELMYGDLDAVVKRMSLSPDARGVVYCEGILCDKSQELAEALRTDGFPYVSVMPDGFEGWQAAGGPTEGGI